MSACWAGSFKFVLTILQPSLSLWAKHNAHLGKDVNQGGELPLAGFFSFTLSPGNGLSLFFGSQVMQKCLQPGWEGSMYYKGRKLLMS